MMPGEWDWMGGGQSPQGGLLNSGGYQGVLSGTNPLFNMGMGILANNTGNYGALAPALGKGVLQGQNQTQTSQSAKQQQEFYKLKMTDQQYQLEQQAKRRKALEGFDQKFPEYAGLADIDEKSALKIAYPQLATNSADPYYQFLPTASGYASGNARTGEIKLVTGPDGQPYIKSADSPEVRGAVKGAEAQAGAEWKPNTDIPGTVTTDADVVRRATGGAPIPFSGLPANIPRLPQQGNTSTLPQTATPNNMRIPPAVQKGRDDLRMTILLQEQRDGGGPGMNPELDKEIGNMSGKSLGGIKVPTPLEIKQAEANITANKELEVASKKPLVEDQAAAKISLPQTIAQGEYSIRLVDELLAHPGLETAVGLSSKLDPRNYLASSDATGFNVRLEQIKGKQFLQAFESLKGGGQITEVEGKKATDAIARMNTSVSEDEFKAGAEDFKKVMRDAIGRAKAKAGVSTSPNTSGSPTKALTLPAKPSKMTLKKGAVYQTPKGALTWNGEAFED